MNGGAAPLPPLPRRGREGLPALLVLLAALPALPAAAAPATPPPAVQAARPLQRSTPDTLVPDSLGAPDPSYPFEAVADFHTGLFHWVDSLAGTSGGKTVPIYQQQYTSRFGRLGAEDRAEIVAFRDIRARHAAGPGDPSAAGGLPGATVRRGYAAMLGEFLDTSTLDEAFKRLTPELPDPDRIALAAILERFEPRYRLLWDEARYLPRFTSELDRPRNRMQVEAYLAELARFFGVSATAPPRPRLVLVPVPAGGGTHAQAVGSTLLLEIRPGDTPLSQVSVIAHENSHFLFNRIPAPRLERLEAAARAAGPGGAAFWGLLREALPTALGQGEASARFFPDEASTTISWYHISNVDRLAKKIFPVVRAALAEGRPLDERLMGEMYAAGHTVVESERPPPRQGR